MSQENQPRQFLMYRYRLVLFLLLLIGFFGATDSAFADDKRALPQKYTCADISQISQAECAVLQALYDQGMGHDGSDRAKWFSSDTPCFWGSEYVAFAPSKQYDAIFCNQANQIVRLWHGVSLPDYAGVYPADLVGQLPHLTHLTIYGYKKLPPALGKLTQLDYLEIGLRVTNVPAEIGQLNLIELQIDGSQVGTLPATIGNLSRLEHLEIYGNNKLTRLPNEIGQIKSLKSLDIGGNPILEAIPDSIGQLSNLESLAIYDNDLLQSIPASIGNLSKLKTLKIYGNDGVKAVPNALSRSAFPNLEQYQIDVPLGEDRANDACVIPATGPWPPCAVGGDDPPPHLDSDCVIPASGPWPVCATQPHRSGLHESDPACVIPESGRWPACARGGDVP